jgi:hypothetical protein
MLRPLILAVRLVRGFHPIRVKQFGIGSIKIVTSVRATSKEYP